MLSHQPIGCVVLALVPGTGLVGATTLEVAIRNTFNGEPLILDSLRYENGAGETLGVTRLSMLLSSFAIEREDGQ